MYIGRLYHLILVCCEVCEQTSDEITELSADPFNEPQERGASQEGLIHIRIQQRNGRKTLTTVQGISDDYDKKKLVKVCKKVVHLTRVFFLYQ